MAPGEPDLLAIDLTLLALAYANVLFWRESIPPLPSSWRSLGVLPAAWYANVAIPLYQFFVLRWLWWFCGWCCVLWRLSRLKLHLLPTHPDSLGGLGVINVAHARFAAIMVPLSLVMASHIGLRIAFQHHALHDYKLTIIAILGVSLVMMLPLLTFTGKLLVARNEGLVDYGAFASGYARAFARKWFTGESGSCRGTRQWRHPVARGHAEQLSRRTEDGIFMWNRDVLVPYVLSAALPLAPLVLTEIPIDQLLRRVLEMLG